MKSKYNSQIHHRRSIRLQDYDYSQDGFYFMTICTKNRECWFGKIVNKKMENGYFKRHGLFEIIRAFKTFSARTINGSQHLFHLLLVR